MTRRLLLTLTLLLTAFGVAQANNVGWPALKNKVKDSHVIMIADVLSVKESKFVEVKKSGKSTIYYLEAKVKVHSVLKGQLKKGQTISVSFLVGNSCDSSHYVAGRRSFLFLKSNKLYKDRLFPVALGGSCAPIGKDGKFHNPDFDGHQSVRQKSYTLQEAKDRIQALLKKP